MTYLASRKDSIFLYFTEKGVCLVLLKIMPHFIFNEVLNDMF